MNPYAVIRRKREGGELESNELTAFLDGYGSGDVAEYQMAAFLMAVFFRGLSEQELDTLVAAMIASGSTLDFSAVHGPKVDKHSTGGVGDKVSLVLAPLAAALGLRVPMMSGRGLGHTGGTVDKLESIPGFRPQLTSAEAHRQLERIGCVLITQTAEVAPLDRRLYALRDVTGTVESIPLIAASIMSKKLAEGLDGLVLDVKRGSGAFLPELERGLELARTMIRIGGARGCRVSALLTAMDRPLGSAIGNALEVEEAVLTLRGAGPPDVTRVTVELAAEMMELGGLAPRAEARARAQAALLDGSALDVFARVVEAQGGSPWVVEDPAGLPQAPVRRVLEAWQAGVIESMDTRAIGVAAVDLGAGRRRLGDAVDPAAGFQITAKPGDAVSPGQAIGAVYARTEDAAAAALARLRTAIRIGERARPLPLISHRVTADGVELLSPEDA